MGCHSEVTPASGSATSTLALTASAGANTGNAPVTVTGISGALTHSTTIALTVKFVRGIADGGLRSTLKAPKCLNAGSGCDSGRSLLLGRDTMSGGAEPNQPNTINNSCAKGTSGTFHFSYWPLRRAGGAQVQNSSGATLAQIMKVASNAQVWTQVTYDLTTCKGRSSRRVRGD